MAIQTTQITTPQPVKNSRVNQSIRAATLRCKVGRANAAKVARAGNASSRARSAGLVVSVAVRVTAANHSGSARCRLTERVKIWKRQRHKVHNTSGQAGQVNHTSRRPRVRQSLLPASWGNNTRQRQRSSAVATAITARVATAMAATARHRLSVASSRTASTCSRALPRPNSAARDGAPLRARPHRPRRVATSGNPRRWPMAATP